MTHTACNHEIKRLENEITRLRAANAELVEALEKLARLGNGSEYGNSDGNMIARSALSRAKQAKPEPCVWTYEAAWVSGCGLQYINAVIDADMKFCPFCGKRIEVKG